MIVLALGTNLGNRLHNLHNAVEKLSSILQNIKTSSIYETDALLPDGAPSNWNIPYYNMVITAETHLDPKALLDAIKIIEKDLGRTASYKWSPRIIDIDILFYNDLFIESDTLTIPHKELLNREFILVPLLQLAPNLKFSGHTTLYGKTITEIVNGLQWFKFTFKKTLPFNPKLMGIINITTDSNSDGGKYIDTEDAIKQALALYQDGAFYLDFGAQSTNPKSMIIDATEEYARLNDVLSGLVAEVGIKSLEGAISIDTYNASVIDKLTKKYPIAIFNDVSAASNIENIMLAKDLNLQYVFMHSIDIPTTQQHLISHEIAPHLQLYKWAEDKIADLLQAGLLPENIIFDPGIGFGKSPIQCLQLMQNLKDFKTLQCSIMVGHSRKYFHSAYCSSAENSAYSYLEPNKRDTETAVEASIIAEDCDILRVHNIRDVQKSIVAANAIKKYYKFE